MASKITIREKLAAVVRLVVVLSVFSAIGCGGGGGGGGDDLSTNACGTLGLGSKSARIVNGTACSGLDRSPVVRVVTFDALAQPLGFCTGTALTSNDVLTAAHCIPAGTVAAAVIYGDPEGAVQVFARVIAVHPGYVPISETSPLAAFNDVAVIELRDPLPLPTLTILSSRPVEAGNEIAIFGYGQDENGEFTFADLKSGEMLVDSVTPSHLSARFDGDGSNTCQGDSGGPATFTVEGRTFLVGVTSSGAVPDCSTGDVSLFTNLQSEGVLNFISSRVPDVSIQ